LLPAISESQILVPAEMFAIADSRLYNVSDTVKGLMSQTWMFCGNLEDSSDEIKTPRHGKGYNVLSCDGHVELISRLVLFDLKKSAQRWNNDHQPHPETWFP